MPKIIIIQTEPTPTCTDALLDELGNLVLDEDGNCISGLASVCADATVQNSDLSYTASVSSGGTLILADTTYNIYVNNVLDQTVTVPTLKDETINISA